MGILLRQKLYPRIFGKCGRKIIIGRFVSFTNPQKIHLGNNVIIGDHATLDAASFSRQGPAIILENLVFIGNGCCLEGGKGKIILQSGSSVGSFCRFKANSSITIGDHVLLAAYCKIGDYLEGLTSIGEERLPLDPLNDAIHVGADCWLGVRSITLPGVSIGEGSIIGAHSIVQESLPPFVIAVGTPAKILRKRFNEDIKNRR